MSFKDKSISVLNSSCPKCHQSKVFNYHPYMIHKAFSMKKNCPVCKADFEPEPSFYTGAMYVSYAFSVTIVVGTFLGSIILFKNPDPEIMAAFGICVAFLFAPLNLRLSRMIWLNVFTDYEGAPTKSN